MSPFNRRGPVDEVVEEFVIESSNNLDRLDVDLVELQRNPGDAARLASVFRTIHTIKGTCGFLAFTRLEAVSHAGENLLARMRDGSLVLDAEIASALAAMVRAIRNMLVAIDATGAEPVDDCADIIAALSGLRERPRQARAPLAVGPPAGAGAVERRGGAAKAVGDDRRATAGHSLGTILSRFTRLAGDLAAKVGKQVDVIVEGEDTELDAAIVEAVKDPLMHAVRNSVAHGIETPAQRVRCGKPPRGRLRFRVRHDGGCVCIEIADDGAGIDPAQVRAAAVRRGIVSADAARGLSDGEAVQLVFRPGFTMAESVTNLSGRGVGMDVVQTNIGQVGGRVELVSAAGEGTTLTLTIPLPRPR